MPRVIVLDTFPVLKRKHEGQHGECRTKRVILEIYDEMQREEETGIPYETRADPPPASGWTLPIEVISGVESVAPRLAMDLP